MSDEHTRVSLLSLLALYPSLDTPAKLFEFLNLRTGYTPILPRSYDSSSDPAPAIDAPTPPIRTDVLRNTEERLVDVPTPDFAKPAPTLPKPNEFSPITTSDSNPDEEPPVKSTPHQETNQFAPPASTSSPIPNQKKNQFTPPGSTSSPIPHQEAKQPPAPGPTSCPNAPPAMSHHTLHPTPVSGPPCPASTKTPSNRKVSFTPVLPVYGAGANKPLPIQAGTFFDTYEKELTRLLEAGVETKTAISTARTLTQAEQDQTTGITGNAPGTINPHPTSTIQGVTPLSVPQWGYNTPPTNPFAPSGQPFQSLAPPDDRTRMAQQEQAMQAFSSVAIYCDRQRSGRFDDWVAHLEATLDLGNFEEARKLRLMRSKLYGEAAEEFDTFKLDNPIRSQDYAAVKARLLKLFHSTETRSQRSVEFHNMKREPEENMRRYANRIRKAFHKAYPMEGVLDSATAASREQMMMDRFIEGLQHDLQPRVKHKHLRKPLLQEYHDSPLSGHLAYQRTILRLRDKYYWPTMLPDVKEYCLACEPCALQRRSNLRAFLNPLDITSKPFELLGLDFLGPIQPHSLQGNNHVLVITDYFTKWVEVIALPDQTALTTSQALMDKVVLYHGPPKAIVTDRGSNFTSELFSSLFNKTVVEMLRKYMDQGFPKWEEMLGPVAFAYRNSVHSSTLETPYFLNHGRDPTMPIDQFLLAPSTNIITPSDYKSQIMQRLHEAFRLVKDNLALAREQQRAQYDKRARQQEFRVGDKVLIDVRAPMMGTSKKLIPRFMGPFRILKVNDNHTVEIQECAGKQTQLVHVNRIKPLYESMIWKEEPCVEFQDNRKEDTSLNLTRELELPAPTDEELTERDDFNLIDLRTELPAIEEVEDEDSPPTETLTPPRPMDVPRPERRPGLRPWSALRPPRHLE
ncbi:hypothetical protein GHT06_021560 [Daphnia sinensis]|uniref:RNA-directed DNA polymerase n=1 Tax=Daphnia sinensis TaxID=1820382 RepID=A0AAD5PN01_9CRUS|nr:hypothetical protein GHT06_021560 [Daphnia sinensis]